MQRTQMTRRSDVDVRIYIIGETFACVLYVSPGICLLRGPSQTQARCMGSHHRPMCFAVIKQS